MDDGASAPILLYFTWVIVEEVYMKNKVSRLIVSLIIVMAAAHARANLLAVLLLIYLITNYFI